MALSEKINNCKEILNSTSLVMTVNGGIFVQLELVQGLRALTYPKLPYPKLGTPYPKLGTPYPKFRLAVPKTGSAATGAGTEPLQEPQVLEQIFWIDSRSQMFFHVLQRRKSSSHGTSTGLTEEVWAGMCAKWVCVGFDGFQKVASTWFCAVSAARSDAWIFMFKMWFDVFVT